MSLNQNLTSKDINLVSQMAENLIPSEIIKLGNEINARKSKGEQIYNLTIGDFDPQLFPIPVELRDSDIRWIQTFDLCCLPNDFGSGR